MRALPGKRNALVEVLSAGFERLTRASSERGVTVTQVDVQNVDERALLRGLVDGSIHESIRERRLEWWARQPPLFEGWVLYAAAALTRDEERDLGLNRVQRLGSGGSPRMSVEALLEAEGGTGEEGAWVQRYLVLFGDGSMLHFAAPAEFAAFRVVGTAALPTEQRRFPPELRVERVELPDSLVHVSPAGFLVWSRCSPGEWATLQRDLAQQLRARAAPERRASERGSKGDGLLLWPRRFFQRIADRRKRRKEAAARARPASPPARKAPAVAAAAAAAAAAEQAHGGEARPMVPLGRSASRDAAATSGGGVAAPARGGDEGAGDDVDGEARRRAHKLLRAGAVPACSFAAPLLVRHAFVVPEWVREEEAKEEDAAPAPSSPGGPRSPSSGARARADHLFQVLRDLMRRAGLEDSDFDASS
jgi:hypothetical protein